MSAQLTKHSKFINFVFSITCIFIIWGLLNFFTSQFSDPTFQIDSFQLNMLFAVIGIFGGVVISIFFYYAGKFRDQYFEYQYLEEEWKEIKQKIIFHITNFQDLEYNSIMFDEVWLKNRHVTIKMVYLVMAVFMSLLVWFVSYIHHANKLHLFNEYVFSLIILSITFVVFIFGWYKFEKALNSTKNRLLLIKHFISNQKIYLYKIEQRNSNSN